MKPQILSHYEQFSKNLNIKNCIYFVANAWEQLQHNSLKKAWNNLGAQTSRSRNQEPIYINPRTESELETERLMETYYAHGIMVTEGVTEE